MSPDALKADRFGSLENISFLLKDALSPTQPRSASDIAAFCEDHSVVFASSLGSTLSLLAYLSFIKPDANQKYVLEADHADNEDIANQLAEKLLSKMSADGILSEFIAPEAIEYDPVEDAVCVRNNFIPLDFSGLKNLLVSIGFLKRHMLSANLLMIPAEQKHLFDDLIVPSIKAERFAGVDARHLSLAALMKIQELNELHGKEAEEFVVEYEKSRLIGSKIVNRIRRISDMQCDAGYDVVSMNDAESQQIDRFIEVKSYSADPSFFWSRNEVAVSETKGAGYFLYLVDRNKISRPGYAPVIIQNPYERVFLNEEEWRRDEMSWHFFK